MSIRNFGMQMVFGMGYNEAQPYIPHKTQTQKCEEKYLNKKKLSKTINGLWDMWTTAR